ncbi:Lecithin:cholesterol acyltransferase [Achromobacter sp. NFACC18-2]|nr:Lecithin:cholesterol acyltransferase [Achromobacter sp. NFACC18-2]
MLVQREGLQPGLNYFEFPYDWRRDNRVAARQLAKLSGEWLHRWRTTSGNASARIVLLAHSMGGLISRYFLECLEGWRCSRLLITFGTPYRGSLNALSTLANGIELTAGPIEFANLSNLFRSFTSVYQLLPTYPCIESPDGRLLRVGEISLDHIDVARVAAAQRFHDEIRDAQSANQKLEDYHHSGYVILPIVGRSQATTQGASLVGRSLQFSTLLKGQNSDGDGTVPVPSAVPLELSGKQRELFVSKTHSSLQSSKEVLTQIAGVIRAGQIDWKNFRGDNPLGMSLRGAYSTSETIRFAGTYSGAVGRPQVSARVEDAYSRKIVISPRALQAKDGTYDAEIGKLPAGTYRVVVELVDMGGLSSRTVEDVCVVLNASSP